MLTTVEPGDGPMHYVIERVDAEAASVPVSWAPTHDEAVGLVTESLAWFVDPGDIPPRLAPPPGAHFGGFHVWRLLDGGRVEHVSWHPLLVPVEPPRHAP